MWAACFPAPGAKRRLHRRAARGHTNAQRARPLTIVDFNSFGSLGCTPPPAGISVWTAGDLEGAVAAHADALYANSEFARAVEEVEGWIEQRHAPATAAP